MTIMTDDDVKNTLGYLQRDSRPPPLQRRTRTAPFSPPSLLPAAAPEGRLLLFGARRTLLGRRASVPSRGRRPAGRTAVRTPWWRTSVAPGPPLNRWPAPVPVADQKMTSTQDEHNGRYSVKSFSYLAALHETRGTTARRVLVMKARFTYVISNYTKIHGSG